MRIGRMSLYLILLVMGFGMFFGGIQTYISEKSIVTLSDEAIIERAKDLGMVELKDALGEKNPEDTK